MYDFNVEFFCLITWHRNLYLTILIKEMNGMTMIKLEF